MNPVKQKTLYGLKKRGQNILKQVELRKFKGSQVNSRELMGTQRNSMEVLVEVMEGKNSGKGAKM